MPIARVQTPQGVARLEVPEGTTPQQIEEFVNTQFRQEPETQTLPQGPQEGLGRTLFDQSLQGATFGFADEITDALGALIAGGLSEDLTIGEAFGQARELTKERQARQLEQQPVATIGANIAGGLLTGGAGATTKAGAAIGRSLRTGNLAARTAKGAAVGATSGAAFGAGTSEDRLSGAGQGAILGGALGAAVPAVGAAASRANVALGPKQKIPNADQLRTQAGKLFRRAEQKGGTLKAQVTDEFIDEIQKLKPQTQIGKIAGGETEFTKTIDRLSEIRGQSISLEAAQELDEILGNAIDNFSDPLTGKLKKEGKKLLDVQSIFRNTIEEADESLIEGGKEGFQALKEARKLWSTSRKLSDIERIIQRAELMDNPATGIKTGFRTLLNNPKRLKAFNKAERKAIRKAAETGVISDTLRIFGSRLIPIITAAGGGGLGGTAASSAASLASRGAATRLQVGRAQNLAELVANQGAVQRTPLIKSNPLTALSR